MTLPHVAAMSAVLALAAVPVAAQSMAGMAMPSMAMTKAIPANPPAGKKAAGKAGVIQARSHHMLARRPARLGASASATPKISAAGMAGMTMPDDAPASLAGQKGGTSPMADMTMSGAASSSMPGMAMPHPSGTDLPPGHDPAPPPPQDRYADRAYPMAAMDAARLQMMQEEGGQSLYQLMFNLAELQAHDGQNGYRWDGEGWFGGDIDRLVLKSEGDGTLHRGVDAAEGQALYSHAIGPYFDLQAGVRQDIRLTPARTYATVGIEGLAPYMFETEAALFLSTRGDVLARAEAWYDARITQHLILQPRVELNFAAQDVRDDRIGAGLTTAELGLRLRYEIGRQFAPYVGLSYESKVGRTATFARRDGESVDATSLVLGVRSWF